MKCLQNETEGRCGANDSADGTTAHGCRFHGHYDALFFLKTMTKLVKKWHPVAQLLLKGRDELGGGHITRNTNALQNCQRRPGGAITVRCILTELEGIQLDGKIFDRARSLVLETELFQLLDNINTALAASNEKAIIQIGGHHARAPTDAKGHVISELAIVVAQTAVFIVTKHIVLLFLDAQSL